MMSHVNAEFPPPPARRVTPAWWRDPRLWLGVLLVVGSVAAGARLFAAMDQSVSVWAVQEEMAAGDTVTADDLQAHRIRFVDEVDLDRYLLVQDDLPADLTLQRDIGSGELLPRAALGSAEGSGLVQLPLVLAAQKVPPGVGAGDRVDVWVTGDDRGRAKLVLGDVVVIEAPVAEGGFGGAVERQLVLGVPGDEQALAAALGAADSGSVTVVVRG